MDFLIRLKDVDRRIIFIFIALAVALPILWEFDFPVFPGKNVTNLFDFVDKLPAGTRCFLSFDYDLASMPELHPGAIALIVHMLRKDIRPICGANWPLGGDMAEIALASATQIVGDERGTPLVRGRDYVNLGYKPGVLIHIKRISEPDKFLAPYPTDKDGNPTSKMEIFQNADGAPFDMKNIGLIHSFTAGTAGIEAYISIASDHKRTMSAACTSVSIPRNYTYIQTNQIVGLVGGMPGAAEYEKLVNLNGKARRGMVPQSVSHVVIILFIILGNLAYLAELSRMKKKSY